MTVCYFIFHTGGGDFRERGRVVQLHRVHVREEEIERGRRVGRGQPPQQNERVPV